jgi:hypothetical protein
MSGSDKIALIRRKYLRLIADKEEEIEELKDKIELLAEIEKEIDSDTKTENHNANQLDLLGIESQKYAKFTLTEAAYDSMIQIFRNYKKDSTRGTVSRYMIANGFSPKGKNFSISVDTALRRMAKSGRIKSELKDGKRLYVIKEEAHKKIPPV